MYERAKQLATCVNSMADVLVSLEKCASEKHKGIIELNAEIVDSTTQKEFELLEELKEGNASRSSLVEALSVLMGCDSPPLSKIAEYVGGNIGEKITSSRRRFNELLKKWTSINNRNRDLLSYGADHLNDMGKLFRYGRAQDNRYNAKAKGMIVSERSCLDHKA